MGYSFYATSICYIVLGRDMINNDLEPKITPNQSVIDWIYLHDFGEVIPGVTEDSCFFDNKRLSHRVRPESRLNRDELDDELTEEEINNDKDWAAIILSNISVESYNVDTFNILRYAKLYKDPKDCYVVTEIVCRMEE